MIFVFIYCSQWDDSFGAASPEVDPVVTVENWLTSIGLPCYTGVFCSQIASVEAIARLTPEDLTRMGITTPSHQKTLLTSILHLREHLGAGTTAGGFLV